MQCTAKIRWSIATDILIWDEVHAVWDTNKWGDYAKVLFEIVVLPQGVEYSPNMGDHGGLVKRILVDTKPFLLNKADIRKIVDDNYNTIKEKLADILKSAKSVSEISDTITLP